MSSERWAAVEIMGHRQHVGRISEETIAGAVMLRVEALQRDGSFEVIRYGGASIFSLRDLTEEAARRAVLPNSWHACDEFEASQVLPNACKNCGHDQPAHEARAKALPAHEPDEESEDLPFEPAHPFDG